MQQSYQRKSASAARMMVMLLTLPGEDALAQVPLSVQQLIVPSRDWQAVTAISFGSHRVSPLELSERDALNVALRYGMRDNLELALRLSGSDLTVQSAAGSYRRRQRTLGAAVNWRVKDESASPALLLELRADLRTATGDRVDDLPAAELLFTTYRSIDPLVLALRGGVRTEQAFGRAATRVSPGDSWWLAPDVSFAVNASVTLTGGVRYVRRSGDRIGDGGRRPAQSQVAFNAGLGYAPDPRNTFFLAGDFAADGGGSVSLQWNYLF